MDDTRKGVVSKAKKKLEDPLPHVDMATEDFIPVVDFADLASSQDLSSCAQVQELHSAFSKVGFVFVKNHGIERQAIDQVFSLSMDFFNQPTEIKKQYLQRVSENDTHNGGYVAMEQEGVDPSKPADLKEAFQVCSVELHQFPDKEVPALRPAMLQLYESSIALARTILEIMGHALKLEDPSYFVKTHEKSGHTGNYTTVRVLHYPPLPSDVVIKPGQLRCGEHVDYGSITLLFQDPTGGLQVKRRDGGYIDVPYMSEAVLVNLGALVQNWTADKYIATPHRVLLPEGPACMRSRQSIAIFLHPDHDTVIRCIDGSDKYPPITAFEDTNRRLVNSYDMSFQNQ